MTDIIKYIGWLDILRSTESYLHDGLKSKELFDKKPVNEMLFSYRDNFEVIKYLSRHPKTSGDNSCLLNMCARYDRLDIVKWLIDECNVSSHLDSKDILYDVVTRNNLNMVEMSKYLIKHGCDPRHVVNNKYYKDVVNNPRFLSRAFKDYLQYQADQKDQSKTTQTSEIS